MQSVATTSRVEQQAYTRIQRTVSQQSAKPMSAIPVAKSPGVSPPKAVQTAPAMHTIALAVSSHLGSARPGRPPATPKISSPSAAKPETFTHGHVAASAYPWALVQFSIMYDVQKPVASATCVWRCSRISLPGNAPWTGTPMGLSIIVSATS